MILIPILYRPYQIPLTLRFITYLDYTTEHARKYFWNKLLASLGYKSNSTSKGDLQLIFISCVFKYPKYDKKIVKSGEEQVEEGSNGVNLLQSIVYLKKNYLKTFGPMGPYAFLLGRFN